MATTDQVMVCSSTLSTSEVTHPTKRRSLARGLEATAVSARAGQVIDRCESLVLGDGREFLGRALEDSLQARADALGK